MWLVKSPVFLNHINNLSLHHLYYIYLITTSLIYNKKTKCLNHIYINQFIICKNQYDLILLI